jgi:hypothetical protein
MRRAAMAWAWITFFRAFLDATGDSEACEAARPKSRPTQPAGGGARRDPHAIQTPPGHKIIARIPIARGWQIDAPRYNPQNGLFYVSLPVIDKVDNKGGPVIDPREAKVLPIIDVMDCAPQGLALGADDHMIIGCNAGSSGSKSRPLTAVLDLKTEKVIASTPKMGGSDMAGYVEKLGLYVVGGREPRGGSSIGLIDAKTNEWVQNIPAPPNAHSVVISQANAHILVPSGKTGGFCGGCILVFGEQ